MVIAGQYHSPFLLPTKAEMGPSSQRWGGEAPDDDPVGDVGVLVRANLDGEYLPYLVRHFLARCRNTKGLK